MAIREQRTRRALPADIRERLGGVPELCRRHGVLLAYLFGSLARNDRPGAPGDVDLAVLLPGPSSDLWTFRLDLGTQLGTDRLDLVDLQRASEVVRFEVLRTGRLLYKASDEVENRFEQRALAEYKDRAVVRRKQARWLRESLDR